MKRMKGEGDSFLVTVVAFVIVMVLLIAGMINNDLQKTKLMTDCIQKHTPEQCNSLTKKN